LAGNRPRPRSQKAGAQRLEAAAYDEMKREEAKALLVEAVRVIAAVEQAPEAKGLDQDH